MKKNLNRVRKSLLLAGGVVLMTFLFSACKKSLDNTPPTPVAALMAFNLAPDKPAIGLSLSGGNLTSSPLSYTSYTGTYLTISPGTMQLAAYDYNSAAPFATVSQNFEVNKYYSSFTLGNNGVYKNIVVNDGLDSLTAGSGQAFVRYINAIPDSTTSPAVTITAGGTEIVNKNEAFASVSQFKGITPGDIVVKVSNGTNITANRTITLERGRVYTVLLIGVPGSTDTDKMVQIKYITNGTVE